MIHATRPFVVNERIQTKIKGYEVTGKVEVCIYHLTYWKGCLGGTENIMLFSVSDFYYKWYFPQVYIFKNFHCNQILYFVDVSWWSPTIVRVSDCEAVHIPNHNLSVNVVRNLSKKSHWGIKTHLAISHLDVNKINVSILVFKNCSGTIDGYLIIWKQK